MENLVVEPTIIDKIKGAQQHDSTTSTIKEKVLQGKYTDFKVRDDGVIRMNGRLWVPNDDQLRKEILNEAHSSGYTAHPGGTKMY